METLQRMPWAAKSAVFKRLEEISELSELTREERIKYDEAIKQYRDNLYIIEGEKARGLREGLREGREKGLAEGRAEGERATALKIATSMKRGGMSEAEIALHTGLKPEEIARL